MFLVSRTHAVMLVIAIKNRKAEAKPFSHGVLNDLSAINTQEELTIKFKVVTIRKDGEATILKKTM